MKYTHVYTHTYALKASHGHLETGVGNRGAPYGTKAWYKAPCNLIKYAADKYNNFKGCKLDKHARKEERKIKYEIVIPLVKIRHRREQMYLRGNDVHVVSH